ncbi:MAG: electron transfer flavoprotein subunit beta/FixA family protein [Candidatus Wallbacteria bacterium]|nr:electron transfer flavoprotein subunit beta/FixA family protein [Candidatus Wallbacteria bacterium]
MKANLNGKTLEIVVCIKQVPGTSEVKLDPKTGVMLRDGVDAKLNPYDLSAIETAVRLKELTGARVSVVSMGPPQASAAIREAFMMGADTGALLTDKRFAGADVLATAYTLSQGIMKIAKPDLIICGKMTTDGDTAQVGPEIAEFLVIPHATNVRRIVEITAESITVEQEFSHALETVRIEFPCLITVERSIYQPRLPSYRLKLATAEREIRMLTLADLNDPDELHYGLNGSPTSVLKVFPPVSDVHQEIWEGNSGELAEKLSRKMRELKFL